MEARELGSIMRKLFQLSRYWEGILDAGLKEEGLTAKQLLLLGVLESNFDEAPAVSQVADSILTSHQNVMRMARVLEKKGFLSLTADPRDRRVHRIALTNRHRRYWRGRQDKDARRLLQLFAPLSADDQQELRRILDRLLPHTEELYRRRASL
ncbi:MAG TPA: MarR family transcriptional regulator [Sediminispirochaeta sp.]|nr:MarR family transcriptional regulator [Sediminispirochaeta sp.]